MEDRRTIHYQGNTVNLPNPSKRNLKKRLKAMVDNKHKDNLKVMPYKRKICRSRVCVWCGNALSGYKFVCNFCNCCQYCGLINSRNDGCSYCGNHPSELPSGNYNTKKRVRVI